MRKLGCLALLAALASGSSALSMSYGLVPLADGTSAIVAEGVIRGHEAARFITAMKVARARDALPLTLLISSPGGNLKSALELGQVVRALRMQTVVGSVTQVSDGPRALAAGDCH